MPDITSGGPSSSHKLVSTSVLGLKLYILLLIFIAILFLLAVLTFLSLRRRKNRNRILLKQNSGIIPLVSEEIKYVGDQKKKMVEILGGEKAEEGGILGLGVGGNRGSGSRGVSDDGCSSSCGGGSKVSSASAGSSVVVEAQNIGWGTWYSLKELDFATSGFSDDNVIGEGGYGIVYRGVLEDGSVVAVKNLRKGQAEREFRVEVEAIGKVRHKNLVGLIGYCAEGAQRMLVYEYIDNGNLEQWLHGDTGTVSPLTWDIRMKIAIGTAKGLAYLHEGLEPKVVHRDVKSSNILLTRSWSPKVSDFGLAKLLGSEASYVTTRVMGTFGYVSPEYASTGMLSEGSDVYSFGVLLMELISGRSPIDYSRPPGEMNLVDWFKGMVANRRGEEVLDPRIQVPPSPRALKRLLLICLRCVDMDTCKRPKMGQIIHMLEVDEFPFRADKRMAREAAPPRPSGTDKLKYPLKDVVAGGDLQRER